MKQAERVLVLMYHRIGEAHNDWERRYCVSPELFAAQMERLAAKGMQACGLDDFFAWLAGDKPLPEGSFLLTFDDGFLGVYEHGAPLLRDMNWPATVFLVSQLIGKRDEWCRSQNPGGDTYPLMTQEHIEALRGMGFSFQSHTRLHADLPTLSDEQLADELGGSRRDLEALLGQPVPYLAYPYGRYDERVLNAAREAGYQAAFSVQPGFNRRDVHPYRIRRLDVFGTDTPAMLLRKMYYGANDGSWRQTLRYYGGRVKSRLGL